MCGHRHPRKFSVRGEEFDYLREIVDSTIKITLLP